MSDQAHTKPLTIANTLSTLRSQLRAQAIDPAALEAEILLAHVLNVPRHRLWAHPNDLLTDAQQIQLNQSLQDRLQGKPMAYITQQCEFWSRSFYVNEAVLIPRPETEHVIEVVLAAFPDETPIRVLELATGSGAIAVTLSLARPSWQIIASDIACDALAVALHNARLYHVHGVRFLAQDWFRALAPVHPFHLIIANPPYLANSDPHLAGGIRYEPRGALVAGETGLEAYAHIIANSADYLQKGGMLVLEMGYRQAEDISKLLIKYNFSDIRYAHDLQGHTRVISAKMR